MGNAPRARTSVTVGMATARMRPVTTRQDRSSLLVLEKDILMNSPSKVNKRGYIIVNKSKKNASVGRRDRCRNRTELAKSILQAWNFGQLDLIPRVHIGPPCKTRKFQIFHRS